MKRSCAAFWIVCLGGAYLPGQTTPQFEVVSVKQCVGPQPGGSLTFSPGRIHVPCWQLMGLIQDAYQIYGDGKSHFIIQPPNVTPIEGLSEEVSRERYTIDGRAESPQSLAMMRGPMMQKVLEGRFHLKIRHEFREVPVYIATVAKEGSRLQAAKNDNCDAEEVTDVGPILHPGPKPRCGVLTLPKRTGTHFLIDDAGVTLAAFCKQFSIGGMPVLDRTGLEGTYDIHLEYDVSPPDPASPENGMPGLPDTAVVSALRKQLGLQLKPGKGPREFLVVEHVERPSEN